VHVDAAVDDDRREVLRFCCTSAISSSMLPEVSTAMMMSAGWGSAVAVLDTPAHSAKPPLPPVPKHRSRLPPVLLAPPPPFGLVDVDPPLPPPPLGVLPPVVAVSPGEQARTAESESASRDAWAARRSHGSTLRREGDPA
jgi:hypothetical protein